MQALLIVNPSATTTSPRRLRRVVQALEEHMHVRVEYTRARGHGEELAAAAVEDEEEAVLTLSGDGTVNEVVNGLIASGRPVDELPIFGPIPGGSTNVFSRALGLPAERVRAAAAIAEAVRLRQWRTVSLGMTDDGSRRRAFTFTGGLGWDAAIIRRVENFRKRGSHSTPALYARAIMAEINDNGTDGDTIFLELPEEKVTSIGMVIVQNCSPWTYVGNIPVNLNVHASFNTGLDALVLRKLGMSAAVHSAAALLSGREVPDGKHAVTYHDLTTITLRADEPQPFQLDGDYLGERRTLTMSSLPNALRVVA